MNVHAHFENVKLHILYDKAVVFAIWTSKVWPETKKNFDLNIYINISCKALVYFWSRKHIADQSDSVISYTDQSDTFS